MSERIDLGDSGAYTFDQEASRCEVYVGPADCPISPRLLEALSNGTATAGGLAEAGWFEVGRIADDEPTFTPDLEDWK